MLSPPTLSSRIDEIRQKGVIESCKRRRCVKRIDQTMTEGDSRRLWDMDISGLGAGNPSRCFERPLAMALNKATDETYGHHFLK
jgi:hypothetical protein